VPEVCSPEASLEAPGCFPLLLKPASLDILVFTMSIRMRHTRSHTGNRRSPHKIESVRLSACDKCGEKHKRHAVCLNCGTYRGKEYLDVLKKLTKKEKKAKQKELEEQQEKQGALDPEALSQK